VILATPRGNREVRLFESSAAIPSYSAWVGGTSPAGVNVTVQNATGLPTVGAAIRLISETVASLPLEIYSGYGADKKQQRESAPWGFLHDRPNEDHSAFDFLSDVAACVESWGNAYVFKLKSRARLLALYVMDPSRVRVVREGGVKVFEHTLPNGRMEKLTDVDVIHVRGFTVAGGDEGLSPIAQHRASLGNAIAAQQFQGRFFKNDATPALYMSVPDILDQTSADRIRAQFENRHGGLDNAGKIAVIGNGATLNTLTVPLKDAQFIEGQEQAAELAARIFLGPASSILSGNSGVGSEEDSLRFVNFCLLPRLRRIELAFASDYDLFPDGSPLYPEFQFEEFLRADAATRAEVQHKQIQSGVLLVDEARADQGRPPLPDGMGQIPQITPVGGAVNPALTPPPTQE
jgi:HK97 family phage portal protein